MNQNTWQTRGPCTTIICVKKLTIWYAMLDSSHCCPQSEWVFTVWQFGRGGGGEEGVINKMINNINGWTVAWNYLGISFPSPEANSGYPVAVWWAHPIGCIATGCTWASMCHPFGSNQCNERDQEQRKVQNLWHRNSTSIISLKQIIQMRGKGYRLKTLITICNNQKLASAYMSNNHNNYRDFLVTYENV